MTNSRRGVFVFVAGALFFAVVVLIISVGVTYWNMKKIMSATTLSSAFAAAESSGMETHWHDESDGTASLSVIYHCFFWRWEAYLDSGYEMGSDSKVDPKDSVLLINIFSYFRMRVT
jgi:hypothetical protein